MSLFDQIRSLLYFFLMGVGYSFLLAYVLCILQECKKPWLKNMLELGIHVLFTIILYLGLIQVNQGIMHLYFIVSLTIGFFLGYIVYQPLILPWAMRLRYRIQKIRKKIKEYKAQRKAKKIAKQQQQEAKKESSS